MRKFGLPRPSQPSKQGKPRYRFTDHEPSRVTRSALAARYSGGAQITTASDGRIPAATDLLFLIKPAGTLIRSTASRAPNPSRATPSSC